MTTASSSLDVEVGGGKQFIGGRWVQADTGATFEVFDPGNGEFLAQVPDSSVTDGLAAVESAAATSTTWAATAPRERGEILRRAFELMIAQREPLGRLIVRENGKALSEALGEVDYAAEFLRWFSEEATRGFGTFGVAPNGKSRIITDLRPVGPSVFVTPWNFPAAMATRKIGPALAAGCTTILKPAGETPLTALAIAEIFRQAGLPDGVLNVVTTKRSSAVVGAMLADPRVRKLSFTGSTEVGRALLKQASERVLNCSMELGGNAPFLVLADADIETAVQSALVAKLRNGGQSCTAANRFYVHRSRMDEFTSRLAKAMGEMRMGHGLDEGVQIGAMINKGATQDVASLVERSTAAGAEVVLGGHLVDGPGAFYEPTVLHDVPADAPCLTEEIFGPVAPIVGFDDESEAIALANDSDFGLVAFVQSNDLGAAMRVADGLEAGMVGVNRGVVSDPAAPFGGWKQSGLGREGAHDGLLEFLETKYIAASW
ncbi:NAD-dependent succinate-semialdehyde dehydrogenase [Rhodococcus sp. NCIMB 12038]|uniref:NAD-dependent succinate-semialdehyde dehydrogenase n=1 Tax=Rhodococcus sp. NCIMB 12038 TaxID=933800 RepID=UPI000B3C2115|nr:NAD-dependent succinate-semialdehyde dehydrogenase [Rhodococcus sp. NCIMB 12038]OUS84273.1 NAD-dependent succinate-semialdehyde dehydrogenase [Rhodococcus sp. NCIMB 12038]